MSAANTFGGLKPILKESYPKKERFKKLKNALKVSKDPMSALHDKSYLNLKGKKGIAV